MSSLKEWRAPRGNGSFNQEAIMLIWEPRENLLFFCCLQERTGAQIYADWGSRLFSLCIRAPIAALPKAE